MATKSKASAPDLFLEGDGQLRLIDKSVEQKVLEDSRVECMGQSFDSEEERRAHFTSLLKGYLSDSDYRKIPGFPDISDEDILSLSNPPWYTACPNPFLKSFLDYYGKPYDPSQSYSKVPFAADVSEGKNDPIYNAHSYHTKVPPRAIVRYILNYTEPGDVVLDAFCGSGMTAAAGQLCGDRTVVEALGYKVKNDGTIWREEADGGSSIWKQFSKLGARRAIVNDLSPAATFIANSYNNSKERGHWNKLITPILRQAEKTFSWMFQTLHNSRPADRAKALKEVGASSSPSLNNCGAVGRVNYVVWSDVFSCSECGGEIVFWDVAVDKEVGKVRDVFQCPHCDVNLTKRGIEAKTTTRLDARLGTVVTSRVQIPAYIVYTYDGKRFEKLADAVDKALADKVAASVTDYWYPTFKLPEGDKTSEPIRIGITHTHHFYTARTLRVLSFYRNAGFESWAPFSALTPRATRMHRIAASRIGGAKQGEGGATVGIINGTLYVPSLSVEMNVMDQASDRLKAYEKAWFRKEPVIVSTQSSTAIAGIPSNSIDYVFIDPPFGANLMYSELNLLWEGWLRAFTRNQLEAIESRSQHKDINEYRKLMSECFGEIFRVLKPGRWVTIEFSNTRASVWNSIQTALQEAGLVVANVSALDKKQGSFNALTNPTSVKQDLIISAYKPNGGLEERFLKRKGSLDSVWDFVATHLKYLPVTKSKMGELEFIVERDPRILFDRMIAWMVRHQVIIPMSSRAFQDGLSERFAERDGMFFLHSQLPEYEIKRSAVNQAPQIELFVSDEKTAIDWLADFLKRRPSTYQDIHPNFIGQLGAGWKQHEAKPELLALLQANFIRYDGVGEIPSQIHGYLSTNYKDLRGLRKNDEKLTAMAKDRWYLPDPKKGVDIERARERALLSEFETYKISKDRKLKVFRTEAVRAGFKVAYDKQDYQTIVSVAERLPGEVLQEDLELLMYFDVAYARLGSETSA